MTTIQPRFELPMFHGIIRLFENRLKFRVAGDGKRIVKLKCDERRDVRRVEVRQIAALMPAAKALLQLVGRWFPIPLALGPNEFEQT